MGGRVWIREFVLDQSGLLSWAGNGVLESRLPSLSSALFGLGGLAVAASGLFPPFLFSLLRFFILGVMGGGVGIASRLVVMGLDWHLGGAPRVWLSLPGVDEDSWFGVG